MFSDACSQGFCHTIPTHFDNNSPLRRSGTGDVVGRRRFSDFKLGRGSLEFGNRWLRILIGVLKTADQITPHLRELSDVSIAAHRNGVNAPAECRQSAEVHERILTHRAPPRPPR
ncbi:hypothetical protein EYF80_039283 [Liparis tanakae]|uniref:Uncharacterized protein n=1 Tax=Liparis tanakae TaxID=230148 RepID=A0A4Z2GCV7_9TELE|nr:hypothetical protein EYF80_039283 [Liparis tanakae]